MGTFLSRYICQLYAIYIQQAAFLLNNILVFTVIILDTNYLKKYEAWFFFAVKLLRY